MIKFFKWFNNKIEMSALWLAGYCFILRIFCEKIFNSISDQTIYAIGMIIGIVFSFLALKMTLRFYEEKIPNYNVFQLALSIIYFVIAPIFMLYFLAYHPLLGAMVGTILFIVTGLIYMVCDIHKKKKQV